MKKPGFLGLAALGILSLMFIASLAWAQNGRRLHYSTLFNPGTVRRRLRRSASGGAGFRRQGGQDYCVHALLKTPKGQVTTILAPQGFMKKQGLRHCPQGPGDGHRLFYIPSWESPSFWPWR